MKKMLTILLLAPAMVAFSQSEKYTKAMEQLIPAVDTARTADGLAALANSFQRIADAEKTQWLPYYYAALCNISSGFIITTGQSGLADQLDPIADKAAGLLAKAEALEKNNSEIYCVKKMIYSLRFLGNPEQRYATDLPEAVQALETAKKLNPENPRVFLLEGQDKLYTPEQFGGSKTEAKRLFEEGLKKFETFKPQSSIHPNWGNGQFAFFISEASK